MMILLTVVIACGAQGGSCENFDSLVEELMLGNKLEPSETQELLVRIVEVAPSEKRNFYLSLLDLSHHEQSNCILDYFMDIMSALEDIDMRSNFGIYMNDHRAKQFAVCKGVLELAVKHLLPTDLENMNRLVENIFRHASGDVEMETLTIPRESVAPAVADLLKSIAGENPVPDMSSEREYASSILEMCKRVTTKLSPAMEVYKVGNSFRLIFGQENIDPFINKWLFNLQVCRDISAPWVASEVTKLMK